MAVALLLAGAIAVAQSSRNPAPAVHPSAKHPAAKPASVDERIDALRDQLEHRIDALEQRLAAKDGQLQKTEEELVEARAAAAKAEARAASEQQAFDANTGAVHQLESAVSGIRTGEIALSQKVASETAGLHKAIEAPEVLHYKGITLTPGGFLTGDAVFRSHATGSEIATPIASIPYEHADSYALSEFFGSGRQSRISLLAEGNVRWGVLRGFYEGDFLGAGTTSNESQSNSYVLRQRLVYAEAETHARWTFSAGQMWSLLTENRQGISTAVGNMALPVTIDPNYLAGFAWTRQFSFRVVKSFNKGAVGVALENPQLLYTASLAGNTPYAVLGSAGINAGLLNAAVSSCSPATQIVNYSNQQETTSGGQTVNAPVPVLKTINSCANLANTSFNRAPDVHLKVALDPGLGHYEVFAVIRFAHETVYPGETTNSYLYGGLKDIATGATIAPALSTAGAFTESLVVGGGGASARLALLRKRLSMGAKGLFGDGVGRYGDSTLPDITANAAGVFVPLHNFSGLLIAEYNATPRLLLWANYGGDYVGRSSYQGTSLGTPLAAQNGEGAWGGHWSAPTAAAVGYGARLLSNSACLADANPGYNGSSTGFYAGASCSAQTRDVQEITGGYWYDLAKGDRGRLRQGIQYSYLVREAWSGAGGVSAKGIENMVFTTFRYYLP